MNPLVISLFTLFFICILSHSHSFILYLTPSLSLSHCPSHSHSHFFILSLANVSFLFSFCPFLTKEKSLQFSAWNVSRIFVILNFVQIWIFWKLWRKKTSSTENPPLQKFQPFKKIERKILIFASRRQGSSGEGLFLAASAPPPPRLSLYLAFKNRLASLNKDSNFASLCHKNVIL